MPVISILRVWNQLRSNDKTRALFAGVNASVVGILLAALYQPVWTSSVHKPLNFAIALAAFLALVAWRAPPWMVVCAIAATGAVASLFDEFPPRLTIWGRTRINALMPKSA